MAATREPTLDKYHERIMSYAADQQKVKEYYLQSDNSLSPQDAEIVRSALLEERRQIVKKVREDCLKESTVSMILGG